MNVIVSSRHGILRLYDDRDVGIHFVHFHPTVAAERIEKRPNGSSVGLQWYGQISSSNREEHEKRGADRYLDIGGDKYSVHG
jgi:hypothetical protein